MKLFRTVHRLVTVVVVLVVLYLGVTGSMIQLVDLRSIMTKAPAGDPNVMAMREAFDGPGSYAVRSVKDYTAPALPSHPDWQRMLATTLQSARLTVGSVPLRYVEFRMAAGRPVGIVESGGRLAEFDAGNGEILAAGPSARTDSESPVSTRNTWKHLHRMTSFGNWALYINVVTGVGLCVLIFTGLVMYFRMLRARSRAGLSDPFWQGGGTWRTWHRRISVMAALFLTVVSLSGLWLAYESLAFGFYMGSARQRTASEVFAAAQRARIGPPAAPRPDPLSAEAEPGRLASLRRDLGLSEDETARVHAVLDSFVQQNVRLHASAAGSSAAGSSTAGLSAAGISPMALHQAEANAILPLLTAAQQEQFRAWREAQLLGMPLATGGPRAGARPESPRIVLGHPDGGDGGTNGERPSPGAPSGRLGGAPRAEEHLPAGGGAAGGAAGRPGGGPPGGGRGGTDPASPLDDAALPAMLGTTLKAEAAAAGDAPIKVVRLRVYAGMPQGVVVTGGDSNQQLVFNAQTGRAVSETEPGYPPVGFPFGWQAHQLAKDIHRGGVWGVPGRLLDLLSGFAMLYLSVSGIWMYFDLWKRRRNAGKAAIVWA